MRVDVVEPMGAETHLFLDTGATAFITRVDPTRSYAVGEMLSVTFDLASAHLFDGETEAVLN